MKNILTYCLIIVLSFMISSCNNENRGLDNSNDNGFELDSTVEVNDDGKIQIGNSGTTSTKGGFNN